MSSRPSQDCIYAPLDVCEEVLIEAAQKLSAEYDWLGLKPLLGDYHGGLGNLPAAQWLTPVCFPRQYYWQF